MQLSHRLGRGIAWNVAAAVFTNGANLLAALILANILGRETFGEFAIVQSTIVSVAGIAQLAMGLTATKFVAQYRFENTERAGRILGLCSAVTVVTGMVGAVLLLLGAPIISTNLLGVPSLAGGMALAGGVVFFSTMNGFQVGALAGLEQYRSIAILSFACAVLHLVLCTTLALLGGLEGVILGLVASATVKWGLFSMALKEQARRQNIHITTRDLSRESDILVRFAVPAALSGVSALFAIWISNALLVRQENGLSEIGLYAAANSLRALLLLFPALANNVGASLINSFLDVRYLKRYRTAFWANFWVTSISLAVGAIAFLLFGKSLLGFFGHDFIVGETLLHIMAGGAVLEGLSIAVYQIVQSRARMWTSLWLVSLPRDCLMVYAAWLLVPNYGSVGLGIAYALSWAVALVMIAFLSSRIGFVPSLGE